MICNINASQNAGVETPMKRKNPSYLIKQAVGKEEKKLCNRNSNNNC
jgi:hypothetical protein